MPTIFAFPGYEKIARSIQDQTRAIWGDMELTTFPDSESLVTIKTDVKGKDVILVCGLEDANTKMIPLIFFVRTAQELGAKSVCLVAPYLGYMRQDTRFNPGEAITSVIFARFLSSLFDRLITLDPHLHRYKSLSEIYTISTTLVHAAGLIGEWIERNIKNPVIIGPDVESGQWVKNVAEHACAPFIVLKKVRHGDKDVEISVPDVERYLKHTPVLVDDIISTARTLIQTIKHLHKLKMKPPICIGIHAVFAGDAYTELKKSGVARIVTTNSITHETNEIDTTSLFSEALNHNF